MCACGFELISQVSSTLWPDINHRNYQSTDSGSNGPSVAQEPSSDHSRQAKTNGVRTRQPRTAHQRKLGAVGAPRPSADYPGRPSRPVGPIAPTSPRIASSLVAQVRSVGLSSWLPPINIRGGVENRTHTHLTTLTSLAHLA